MRSRRSAQRGRAASYHCGGDGLVFLRAPAADCLLRQDDGERGAHAGCALAIDGSVEGFDDLTRDGEAEAGAPMRRRVLIVRLEELVEDARELLRWNAR